MKFNYFTGIIALLVVFSSCKKKSDDEVTPEPENNTTTVAKKYGKAVMHLHTFVGDEELEGYSDDIYLGDRRISMKNGVVNMYQFELVDMSGNIVKISDTALRKTPEVISYYINKIPIGKYKALRFKVGYDTTKYDAVRPGEPKGGIVQFSGMLDTASTPNENNPRMAYEYALETRTKDILVILPTRVSGSEFNIPETGTEYFHLYMDLNVLFSGINLSDPKSLKVVSSEENKSSVADRIASNISNMFRYE